MHQDSTEKVKNILTVLAQAKKSGEGFLWIREVARRAKINPASAKWLIEHYLWDQIEFMNVDPLLERGLKLKPLTLTENAYQQILKNQ